MPAWLPCLLGRSCMLHACEGLWIWDWQRSLPLWLQRKATYHVLQRSRITNLVWSVIWGSLPVFLPTPQVFRLDSEPGPKTTNPGGSTQEGHFGPRWPALDPLSSVVSSAPRLLWCMLVKTGPLRTKGTAPGQIRFTFEFAVLLLVEQSSSLFSSLPRVSYYGWLQCANMLPHCVVQQQKERHDYQMMHYS